MILNVKINQERLQEALEVFLKENIGDYISFEEEHEEEAVEALNESTDLHPNDLHPYHFYLCDDPFQGSHEEYKYIAVDENGDAYAYTDEPFLGESEWTTTGVWVRLSIDHEYDETDWKKSLITRSGV